MQKICANPWCQQTFEITDDDLKFYDKVSPVFNGKKYQIPPPRLCPECRDQRRLTFRNERNLYRSQSSQSEKPFISYLSPDKTFLVFSQSEWWNDEWNPGDYQKDFDFNQSFSFQFEQLLHKVPRMNLLTWQSEKCDYCNFVDFCKGCYLTFGASNCEDVYFSNLTDSSVNCADLTGCKECELCYDCVDCVRCNKTVGSVRCKSSNDLFFCYDCRNCQHCLGCFNLQNKQYYIENKSYSKEEYDQKINTLTPEKFSNYQTAKEKLLHYVRGQAIHRAAYLINCTACSGDNLTNSKNARQSFESNQLEDCSFTSFSMNCKDAGDIFGSSKKGVELTYEGMSIEGKNILTGFYIAGFDNIFYSDFVVSCSNLFGCAGLKHKQFCILNKQYTKEEYEKLVPKIIEKMKADKEWGEFFPVELSPFAYNETVAQEYFPLTKEEVIARGWKWRDQTDEMPKVTKVIPASKLPDCIDNVPDDIVNWAVECEITRKPFKIIKQELDFYRKMRLPVPHFHPDERHRQRMALRNPRKLWKRNCDKCGKEIETTYSPERPEIIYCEECYLKEVY